MNRTALRRRLKELVLVVGVAGVINTLWSTAVPIAGQAPLPGQFPPYKAPRLAGSPNPDLNGIWQAFTTANVDIEDHVAQPGPHPELLGAYGAWPAGQSIVEGGGIPYQAWALEKRRQNVENRLKADLSDDAKWHDLGDPELKCYMPGVPRATYMPMPFQIVQGSSPYSIS